MSSLNARTWFVVFCLATRAVMSAEEGKVRQPLPSPEEIAKLPADGGDQFNRLIFTQSPYLLQHARNPVDWYPWGEEAFARAKKENKPVFLSVGYTTCHWCHVMEHESFEDEEVAAILNKHFVPVKVDREERPDIDEVYMTVTQALTGGGGWPMSVFMTPDKDPFYAGTYYPKETVAGRPGFKFLLGKIQEAWTTDRENVVKTAEGISTRLGEVMTNSPGGEIPVETFRSAYQDFQRRFDPEYGGFSASPKFPVPPNLMFLLRYHKRTGEPAALQMAEQTLTAMRMGGVYDQIGYGIHRYATDRRWLLPHFEKMLYDQAMAIMAYVEAWQVTNKDLYMGTAEEIIEYVFRDMTSPEGGFYSAEDADSEGEEGKFYVWSIDEVKEVLGEKDGRFFAEIYQMTEEGNFLEEATRQRTGHNIPHLNEPLNEDSARRIEPLRKKLFEQRKTRVHPQKDDKILTDWNGLMISALARAGQALDRPAYTEAAARAADFVEEKLTTNKGRLLKRYRAGQSGLPAHLEDYVFMIQALLDLYESTFEADRLVRAIELQETMDEFFWDKDNKGYFMTASDSEKLIVRAKKLYGGAIPSGNSVAVLNLQRLYRMTGRDQFLTRCDELITAFSQEVMQNAMVYPVFLCGLDFVHGPSHEVVICSGEDKAKAEEMIKAIRRPFHPNKVVLFRSDSNAADLIKAAPFVENQTSSGDETTVYVCEDFACKLPVTDPKKALENLGLKK